MARMRADRSVLDVVTEDLSDLDAHDRAARSRAARRVPRATCARPSGGSSRRSSARLARSTVPSAPIGVPESFEDHASLMFDLLALAFQTDQTRVFTFMLCREFSVRTYPNLGVTDPHHTVSHTQNRPALIAAHTKVNTYHVQLFARFLERLQATPDGDGSLLDHSTILYGSGMGDGNNHTPSPLPIALVGGTSRAWRTAHPHAGQDSAAEPAPGARRIGSGWSAELRHQHRSGLAVTVAVGKRVSPIAGRIPRCGCMRQRSRAGDC